MATMTREILSDTLKNLLRKKSLDRITVTELVSVAGVNRQTFYYNFQDIYDLLEWTIDREALIAFEDITDYEKWKTWLVNVFKYFQKNKRMIHNVFQPLARPVIERYLQTCFEPVIDKVIRFYKRKYVETKNLSEKDLKFIVKTYTLIVIGLVFEWVDNEITEDAEEFIAPYIHLLDKSYLFMSRKFL